MTQKTEKINQLEWISSALADLKKFPTDVKETFGYALYLAECGEKHKDAKPLKGFHGSSVVEVVEDYVGDTYRAIYTVKLKGYVYILHCFKKKSKKGIKNPKHDMGDGNDSCKMQPSSPNPYYSKLGAS